MPWNIFQKRDTEVISPPVSLQTRQDANRPSQPPTYVFTQRREPQVGPTYRAAPDDQFQGMVLNNPSALGLSMMQDAPDPIRQSYGWADGGKVRPWAAMRKTSKLNIAYINSIMQNSFSAGKLKQYRQVPMFEGTQLPSVQRYNIAEGQSGTFGSQYEVPATVQATGPLTLANGMSYTQSLDGHPY